MTQTRTLLFAVLLFPQVLKAADPRDSSSASSRRIKVAVGRIQEGGQVRNIHNQVALGLGDMVSRLGYFDVIDVRAFYALIPDAVKKAKGGLTLAPQADAAKAQGIPNVLIGKVLRADVGREAVRSAEGDRPLWEVRAHVEFEYQFVDSGSRQILATGRATGGGRSQGGPLRASDG